MNQGMLLIGVVLLLCITIELYNTFKMSYTYPYSDPDPYVEPFEEISPGDVNSDGFLLSDSYMKHLPVELVSKYNEQMWKKNQPIKLGSYDQETNNIKYPINPDDGTCIPSEFCYTFYVNNKVRPNKNLLVRNGPNKKIGKYQKQKDAVRIGIFSTPTGNFF